MSATGTQGQLHDLGYHRYAGPRRVGSQLWKVIAWRGLRTNIRSWPVIALLVIAGMATISGGVIVYFLTRFSEVLTGALNIRVTTTILVIASVEHWIGFAMALVVGASVFTDDFRTGALVFYFSRPVTRVTYLIGKLTPVFVLVAMTVLVPPVLLSLEVLVLSGKMRALLLVAEALAHGALATAALAAPAALISTFVRRRGRGLVIFFGLYVGSAVVAQIISSALGVRWARTLGIANDIQILAQVIYREAPEADPLLAAFVLFMIALGSLMLAARRLRRIDQLD